MAGADTPKYILNATPIVMGGGLQAGVAFILEAMNDQDIDWYFMVSPAIKDQLQQFSVDIESERFTVIDSPAVNRKSRQAIKAHIADLKPKMVFTFFGPAYVRVSTPHLMGVADGWITHSSLIAMRSKKGLLAWFRFAALFIYKRYWYKQADRWIVEADCAKAGMLKRFFIESQSIDIVPNSCSKAFEMNRALTPSVSGRVRVLFISAYYPHKNFGIIPQVAAEIKATSPELDIEFVITIPKNNIAEQQLFADAERLGVSKYLVNEGPVAVSDAPALYRSCHLVLMPSLLETFSAIYPEAMISGLPIVTVDLDFARSICRDAAVYYAPLDANDAARCIIELVSNPEQYGALQQQGRLRFADFPDQQQKYRGYCDAIARLLDKEGRLV